MEELEAAAEERDPVSQAEEGTSRAVEEEEGGQSTTGSAYNPENPYHVSASCSDNAVDDKQAPELVNFWLTTKRHTLSPEATLKVTLWSEVSLFVNTFAA